MVSFFNKACESPFIALQKHAKWGTWREGKSLLTPLPVPPLWFLCGPHSMLPLRCLLSLKDLFCLAKSYKGCVAKEDLKVPFGDRAYMAGGGKLPLRSQPAAMGNLYLHNQARWKSRASFHDAMRGWDSGEAHIQSQLEKGNTGGGQGVINANRDWKPWKGSVVSKGQVKHQSLGLQGRAERTPVWARM